MIYQILIEIIEVHKKTLVLIYLSEACGCVPVPKNIIGMYYNDYFKN